MVTLRRNENRVLKPPLCHHLSTKRAFGPASDFSGDEWLSPYRDHHSIIMAKAKRAAKASAPKAKKTVKKSTKKAAPKKK